MAKQRKFTLLFLDRCGRYNQLFDSNSDYIERVGRPFETNEQIFQEGRKLQKKGQLLLYWGVTYGDLWGAKNELLQIQR